MSELQRDIEKLYEFLKNANVGFVLIFFLAIYPVYMFGVLSSIGIKRSMHSLQYNGTLLATSVGFINEDNLTFGSVCSGSSCEAYVTSAMRRQISADARGALAGRIFMSMLGLLVLMLSASMWVALLIGIPGNGYKILVASLLMSIPALPMMAGQKTSYEQRVCSENTRAFHYTHEYTGTPMTADIPACVIVAGREPRE